MKALCLILVLSFILIFPTFADINPEDPVEQQFVGVSSCFEATNVAYEIGEKFDQQVATQAGYFAAAICAKDFDGNEVYEKLYNSLGNICDKKYEQQSGNMYLTFNAFCHLKAAFYVNDTVEKDIFSATEFIRAKSPEVDPLKDSEYNKYVETDVRPNLKTQCSTSLNKQNKALCEQKADFYSDSILEYEND